MMKNLLGKWNVAESLQFNDEKCQMEWVSVEKILAKDDLEKDMVMLMKTVVDFHDDGTIDFLCPLPEGVSQEEINAALAEGQLKLKDGMMLLEEKHWKEEDGKIFTDTGAKGEVLGEKVGPWEELKVIDDEKLEMMMYRLKKA